MKITEKLIWKYVENQCSPKEFDLIRQNISSDSELKEMYEEIKLIHSTLSTDSAKVQSIDLTDKIMAKINEPPTTKSFSFGGLKYIFGISSLVLVSSFALFKSGVLAGESVDLLGSISQIEIFNSLGQGFTSPQYASYIAALFFGVLLCLIMDDLLNRKHKHNLMFC